MAKRYRQLNEAERLEIFTLHERGESCREIGRILERTTSTISRELRRNRSMVSDKMRYMPVGAQQLSMARRRQKRHCKIERFSLLKAAVYDRLLGHEYSPEQISGRLKHEQFEHTISAESIYRYIYSAAGQKEGLHKYLPYAKKRRGRRVKRSVKSLIPNRISIHDRPDYINDRTEFGHWEGDLMAFSKPHNNVLVVVERQVKFIFAARQNNKKANTIAASIAKFQAKLPPACFRSITYDNGAEFTRHEDLIGSSFFCDPHAPWQKGTVENTIGRLRKHLPRSTTQKDYSNADFHDIIETHNHTPRKCLGFKTPAEAFLIQFNCVALGL
jgi:IS30 family transposase